MSTGLIYATRWEKVDDHWRCKLLLDGERGEVALTPGDMIALRVEPMRYCTGYSQVTRDYSTSDSWKERFPCPTSSVADSGNQCRSCAANDASSPCARCTGESCGAHPSVREKCEGSEAYVYLALFGDRVKAGVSQGRRVEKRWVEQGADAARRILRGNGLKARVYEKRIQDELGALRLVKAGDKMTLPDAKALERGLRNLDELTEAVHRLLPSADRIDEEPRLLTQLYGLPQTKMHPIKIKVRSNAAISGRILGAKGPVLFLEHNATTYSLSLHSLVGRMVSENLNGDALSQSGLGQYMKR